MLTRTVDCRRGAPERAIMRQGRWSSWEMVDRSVRHGTIWKECAAYMGL